MTSAAAFDQIAQHIDDEKRIPSGVPMDKWNKPSSGFSLIGFGWKPEGDIFRDRGFVEPAESHLAAEALKSQGVRKGCERVLGAGYFR